MSAAGSAQHCDVTTRCAAASRRELNVSPASSARCARPGLRSYVRLPGNFNLYAGARYVAELPAQRVPSYTAVDANLEWQSQRRPLRVSFTVQNLNDDRHLEFGGDTYIERSALVRLIWSL
jgi:hypothetical protein